MSRKCPNSSAGKGSSGTYRVDAVVQGLSQDGGRLCIGTRGRMASSKEGQVRLGGKRRRQVAGTQRAGRAVMMQLHPCQPVADCQRGGCEPPNRREIAGCRVGAPLQLHC